MDGALPHHAAAVAKCNVTKPIADANTMAALVRYLVWAGVPRSHQAEWLGCLERGAEEMTRIIADESSVVTRQAAFDFLWTKFDVTMSLIDEQKVHVEAWRQRLKPEPSTGTADIDAAQMEALVDFLYRDNLDSSIQSRSLGYSGWRGQCVMKSIIDDEEETMPRKLAFALLTERFKVTPEQLRVHDTKPAAQAQMSENEEAPARFRRLVAFLRDRVEIGTLCERLGFIPGSNSDQILERIANGKSRVVDAGTAFDLLRWNFYVKDSELRDLASGGASSARASTEQQGTKQPGGGASSARPSTEQQGAEQPGGASSGRPSTEQQRAEVTALDDSSSDDDSSDIDDATMWALDDYLARYRNVIVETNSAKKFNRFSRTYSVAIADVYRHRATVLIDFLRKERDATLSFVSQWLGYSGANGRRDVENVLNGSSSRVSVRRAFEILSKKFKVPLTDLRDWRKVN